MNTNKMLTYLLYALLIGLIAVAGYKTWQDKKNKARLAKETAEFEQSQQRSLGYIEQDSFGTLYDGDEVSSSSVVITDGIEDEVPPATTTTPPPAKPSAGTPPADPKPQSAAPSASAKPAQKQPLNLDSDKSDGRYRVIAGSFTKLDGARREMERIIKMGYQDAEIGYYNRSKYAVVVVKRTDNLNEAIRIVDALERKGIDASVIDRERRK